MEVLKNLNKPLISSAKKLLPILGGSHHKGQSGRVGVIGGSLEYTGAPYFAAISAMKTGTDLVHVICETSAAGVIKTYSPDLIVHPLLTAKKDTKEEEMEEIVEECKQVLKRMHSIVIGPGLSRNKIMLEIAKRIILEAKKLELPIVVDADGLFLIQNEPQIIKGYKKAILTPNLVEFERLCKIMDISMDMEKEKLCHKLSLAMNGVTIIQKGKFDIVSNGINTYSCEIDSGAKRCGGQGDLLSGILGAFMAWEELYYKRGDDESFSKELLHLSGCYAACTIVRKCSLLAFKKHDRATQASDMIPEIGGVVKELFFKSYL
ncbi:carbohydrate kinase [Neoconidiobolus thromboides FSU 785]|nr:carbohydrate kinase [Neoconidiobolus thromboides FSU 785]